MKIGVIGAGRLGICFALLCEKAGYNVLVSDIREDYVRDLNLKNIVTNEPQVPEFLRSSSRLRATTDNKEVIRECDVIYTLVATPSLPDGSYDVSSIWNVVNEFQELDFPVSGKSFIVGCTTNPGDCENFQKQLSDLGVEVFYNPEFIAQGSIIKDLQYADMVLVGGPESNTREFINTLYNKIQISAPKINFMSTTAAELVKLAVNCYLTTKISYANMVGEVMTIAGLEDEIGTVLKAIGEDSRVGSKYLGYGFGFGGPCLPRDNRSFAAYAKKLGLEFNLGSTTDDVNEAHAAFLKNYFIEKNTNNLPFAFDYISYKKGTDIITESQQYRLCLDLLDAGYKVYVNDVPPVLVQVREHLTQTYTDKVVVGSLPEEEVFWIKL